MGRAFHKDVRDRYRRSPLDPLTGFLHSHTHFSETALERRLRHRGESPALRRACAPALRPQPLRRCEAAWLRAVQHNLGNWAWGAGCPVRTRQPDLRRECGAEE